MQSISGVLHLSTKYEFWTLRKKAIRVLEMLNPTELKEFMARCSASVERLTEDERAKQMARLFSIVELSKNCGLLQFLPIALYRIGRLLAPNGSQDNHLLITVSEFAWLINIWACKCIIPSALIFLIIQWTNHGPSLHVSDKNRT
jgi:hypothetical protein